MYKVQRQGRWEAYEGRIVEVCDETLMVEDGAGVRAAVPVASVQGWVYDPTPARRLEEPMKKSLSEGVGETDPA